MEVKDLSPALLIEDEVALGQAIELAFLNLGLHLHTVTTLSDARLWCAQQTPRLIILDRNLPDGDGMNFCKELRHGGHQGLILMLTAQGGIQDRVEGLEAGADDYLPKPFSFNELSARVAALARRLPSENTSHTLWLRDPKRHAILGPKGWVTLTSLEYKLVSHLIDANGSPVSRDELLREVWGFRFLPKTRTVDFFMGKIRRAFEPDPENPVHFLTVRGSGYRFESGLPIEKKDS